LNQNLTEIKVELIYSNKNIGYKPALEEMKQKYYKEVKAFITLPSTNFQGLGGNQDIFKQIPEKNSKYLSVVYSKTEELFEKLFKFTENFKAWTVIGALEMESIIEKYFKTNEDWDGNLKGLRLKRRELEKIPETHKIDCFTISLSPFKNAIEDLIQRHIEAITNSLKNSIKTDCDEIDEFINVAYEKLTKKPQSIEEITQAKGEIYEVNQKRLALSEKFRRAEEKNKLLRNMVGNAYNISQISKRWENFDVSLEGFNKMLGEQQEVIKGEIEKRAKQASSDIEKFYQRWSALKPKKLEQLDRESAKEFATKMKEWRTDWN
jgi:dynein heavy chain 2